MEKKVDVINMTEVVLVMIIGDKKASIKEGDPLADESQMEVSIVP
jgi:hypothetical protein